MYGLDILCGISKGTFEIPHQISYQYIERCAFYLDVKIWELLDLRAHKCFWNAPQESSRSNGCQTPYPVTPLPAYTTVFSFILHNTPTNTCMYDWVIWGDMDFCEHVYSMTV